MAAEKKYKLSYFDLRGRGEVPRMIFNYLDVDFEDRRIQFSEWPVLKATCKLANVVHLKIYSRSLVVIFF